MIKRLMFAGILAVIPVAAHAEWYDNSQFLVTGSDGYGKMDEDNVCKLDTTYTPNQYEDLINQARVKNPGIIDVFMRPAYDSSDNEIGMIVGYTVGNVLEPDGEMTNQTYISVFFNTKDDCLANSSQPLSTWEVR